MRRIWRARIRTKRTKSPARIARIEGLMMKKKGVLGTIGVVGLIMALLLKDLVSAGVMKVTLLPEMVNDEGHASGEPGLRCND